MTRFSLLVILNNETVVDTINVNKSVVTSVDNNVHVEEDNKTKSSHHRTLKKKRRNHI